MSKSTRPLRTRRQAGPRPVGDLGGDPGDRGELGGATERAGERAEVLEGLLHAHRHLGRVVEDQVERGGRGPVVDGHGRARDEGQQRPDHDRGLELELGPHEDRPGPQVGVDGALHEVPTRNRSWGSAAAVRTAMRLVTVSATTPVAFEWWSSNSWGGGADLGQPARQHVDERGDHDEEREAPPARRRRPAPRSPRGRSRSPAEAPTRRRPPARRTPTRSCPARRSPRPRGGPCASGS